MQHNDDQTLFVAVRRESSLQSVVHTLHRFHCISFVGYFSFDVPVILSLTQMDDNPFLNPANKALIGSAVFQPGYSEIISATAAQLNLHKLSSS